MPSKTKRRVSSGLRAFLVLVCLGVVLAPFARAAQAATNPATKPATKPANVAGLGLDGPHVWIRGERAERLVVESSEKGLVLTRQEVTTAELRAKPLTVVVDDEARTRFEVTLRAQHPTPSSTWPAPERLLVTSDIEGNFDVLVRILRSQGVLDEHLAWSFGKDHVVVLGDSVDRGSNVTQCLWLLYKLDGEARAAGGALHVLLGNHEAMNMAGDARYLAPKYKRLLEETGLEVRDLVSDESELGRWLRSKNALERIGALLFVHAGIGPSFLERGWTLDETNARVRQSLGRRELDADGQLCMKSAGPLWYRGLVTATDTEPKAAPEHVTRVLEHFDVRAIVVAHTVVESISSDYQARVVRVDLRHPKRRSDGVARALLVLKGERFVVGDDGSKESLR